MTIWFRIPASKEAAFKTAYLGKNVRGKDNPNEDEKTALVPNADGTMLMMGSSRITMADAQSLGIANAPWLEILDHWPPDPAKGETAWEPKS